MSAAADLLLPAPVAPGHPGQHVALKTEPCVRFEDSVLVSGFWGCREESPGRCAAGVEEGGRRQCEGSRPAEQSECMWVCVCVPGVGAPEWFLGAGGLGVHGSVWTCVTLNAYVCACTVTRCASPRVCVRKSTHLCLNVCVPVTERRGGRECVCVHTPVRACVFTPACISVLVRVCVCACGLCSWSRVPWPVFLLPRPPSQQVLTQGGMGSLLSGFPGWVEVVPWKGNNCALKWTLKGPGCAAPCGVQGHQAMCPPRLGIQRPYRQALPTSEPTGRALKPFPNTPLWEPCRSGKGALGLEPPL